MGLSCFRAISGMGWMGSLCGAERAEEVDQGKVSTIILGMLESSGFRKYSTLLVIQLFSRRLCLCHCLCIRLCLCICLCHCIFRMIKMSYLISLSSLLFENIACDGSFKHFGLCLRLCLCLCVCVCH